MDAQDPVSATEVNDVDRPAAVRWLSPTELGRAGLKVLLGSQFGMYVDKREMLQGPDFEQEPFEHTVADGEPFWLDFVSDIGDGFDATYSVASLLAGDLKDLDGSDRDVLRRGAVLVMGGDEVYPTGDVRNYKRRTTDVYAAALPDSDRPRPVIYAVPGNHDWYDGLTAFLRTFGQEKDIGGWKTRQRRSYFALQLPHRWWLFGLDIQLNTYIDRPQLEYFRKVGEQMAKGDRLILCTAKPAWYKSDAEQTAGMAHLAYFLKYTLAETGVRIPLVLTGDAHHYARYSVEGGDCPQSLVTAGHGGAFLSATHQLPSDLDVPDRISDPSTTSEGTRTYDRARSWPDESESKAQARGIWHRLPLRNSGLLVLFSVLQALFVGAVVRPSWPMVVVLLALTVGGSIAFARPDKASAWAKRAWGISLSIPVILLSWGIAEACSAIVDDESGLVVFVGIVVAGAIAGVLTGELLAIWLLIVGKFGVNLNELFAGQLIEDYKGFLRLRIDPDGSITLYPVGVRRSVHDWVSGPNGGPTLVPAPGRQLDPILLESPIRIAEPATTGLQDHPSVIGGA